MERRCADRSASPAIRLAIPTALTRPRTSTHGTPRRRPHAVDATDVIAIAAIAAKSPQALPSIPPSHDYVCARIALTVRWRLK
jgi:hypothetical protein